MASLLGSLLARTYLTHRLNATILLYVLACEASFRCSLSHFQSCCRHISRSLMPSKFSPRLAKRGLLNSKRGNKNYFKGYNSRIEGTHSTKVGSSLALLAHRSSTRLSPWQGAYFVREERLMRIVAPDLTGFSVRGCDLSDGLPTSHQHFSYSAYTQLKAYVHGAVRPPRHGQRVPDFGGQGSAASSASSVGGVRLQ